MDDPLIDTTRWADPARLRVEVQALREELRQADPARCRVEVQGVQQLVTELRQEFVYERETRHHNDHNMMNVISTMKDALRQESAERQSRTTEFDNFMEMTTQIMHETQAHFRHEMQLVQETQTNIKGWMEERQQGATQLSNAIKEVQKKLSAEASERAQQAKAVEDVCKNFAQMRQETNLRFARTPNSASLEEPEQQDITTTRSLPAFTRGAPSDAPSSPKEPLSPVFYEKSSWDKLDTDRVRFAPQSDPKDSKDSEAAAGGTDDGRVTLLAALNSLKKSFDQEVHERVMNSAKLERHLRNFQQLRNELQNTSSQLRQDAHKQVEAAVAHTNQNIEDVKNEFKKQCESTEELLRVINRLKDCFDKEVNERIMQTVKLERHIGAVEDLRKDLQRNGEQQRQEAAEQAHAKIGETNRNLEEVKAECQRQRATTEELLRTINNLKSSLDKEQADSIVKHRQVLKSIEETQSNVMRCNDEAAAAVAAVTAPAAAPETASTAPPAIVETYASDRLKRLRAETARMTAVQSSPAPRAFSEDLASTRLLELPAPAASAGGSVRSEASDRGTEQFSALQEELEKKALDAIEREKEERTSSFSTLSSHIATFQYNLSTERNERSRLHSDLMDLKASFMRQHKELREQLDIISAKAASRAKETSSALTAAEEAERIRASEEQDKRFQRLELQVLQHSELITVSTGSVALTAVMGEDKVSKNSSHYGANNMISQELVEQIRTEVLRVFGERQPSLLSDMASADQFEKFPMRGDIYRADSRPEFNNGSLDRLVREADLFKVEQSVQRLEAIVIGQSGDFRKKADIDGHKELKASSQQEHVTREEFENVTRHIWEAIAPEAISRAEFDSHAHRLWDAIVQLQSRQLEDIRQDAREAVERSFAYRENMASPDILARSRNLTPQAATLPARALVSATPPPPPVRSFQAPTGALGSSLNGDRPPPLGLQNLGSGVMSMGGSNSGGASPAVPLMITPGSVSPRSELPYERYPVQQISQSPNPSPLSARSRAAPAQCGGDAHLPMSDAFSPRGHGNDMVTRMSSPRQNGRIGYHVKSATRTVSMQ